MLKSNKVVHIEMKESTENSTQVDCETISIIGTGNYGISLGKRLIHYGFKVAYGSRVINNEYVSECLDLNEESSNNMYSVNTIRDSFFMASKFVFFAVNGSQKVYESIVEKIFENSNINSGSENEAERIVIDISNLNEKKLTSCSNAELLESLFKKYNTKPVVNVQVVKGFNLISAYKMSENLMNFNQNLQAIPISGNSASAKDCVVKLCSKIGFQAYDFGPLKNALQLEKKNLEMFPGWLWPSVFSISFLIFNSIWIFFWSPIFPRTPGQTFKEFVDYFSLLGHFSRMTGLCAFQILAYVYLAGLVATLYQLYYGTQ